MNKKQVFGQSKKRIESSESEKDDEDCSYLALQENEDFEQSVIIKGEPTPLNISDFKLCMIPNKGAGYLGEGSFGKVYLAQLLSSRAFFAIKAIRKSML